MNEKLLVIKEFDMITCNEEFEEDEFYKFLSNPHFDDFERFVKANTADDETIALDFFRVFSKKGVGTVIQAKNYVGLIQLESGYQVQILPKIDFFGDDETDLKSTRIFINMLRSMKDFPGKAYGSANLKTENMNLYELFISMYLEEVTDLTKRGLKSAYTREKDNLNYFKGQLLFDEHIKRNSAHKEKLYVSYDEFSLNRAENRLIKSTLLKLQKLSTNSNNLKSIRQLLVHFENIEPSNNYAKDFSKVNIDRNSKDYENIIILSKVFLLNKSFSTFSGDTSSRAILFPMEKVFEAYVGQKVRHVLSEINYDVSVQDTGYYLFNQQGRGVFSLRPDIVITREDSSRIIMDTKWKRLINDEGKNYGISQVDMYQMFAYSKKYNTPDIWLLYPKTKEVKGIDNIVFVSPEDDGSKVKVSIFFVDLNNIDINMIQLRDKVSSTYMKV